MRLIAVSTCFVLSACSTGTENAPETPESTFGLAVNTVVNLSLAGTSQNGVSNAIGLAEHNGDEDQFWVRASEADTRVFRYGRPGSGNSGKAELRRHVFRVPLKSQTIDGVALKTGTLDIARTELGDEFLPNPVDSREFALREIPLTSAVAGVLEVDETPVVGSSVLHAYGFAGGTTPLGVSGSATYSGSALATVLADDGSLTRHVGDAELSVNFDGGTMSGSLHDGAITLSGTQLGPDFSGTATVATGALGLTTASSGGFEGGVFGASGEEAAGALGITDSDGSKRLSAAFGAARN